MPTGRPRDAQPPQRNHSPIWQSTVVPTDPTDWRQTGISKELLNTHRSLLRQIHPQGSIFVRDDRAGLRFGLPRWGHQRVRTGRDRDGAGVPRRGRYGVTLTWMVHPDAAAGTATIGMARVRPRSGNRSGSGRVTRVCQARCPLSPRDLDRRHGKSSLACHRACGRAAGSGSRRRHEGKTSS